MQSLNASDKMISCQGVYRYGVSNKNNFGVGCALILMQHCLYYLSPYHILLIHVLNRHAGTNYAKQIRSLYLMLMDVIRESLGLVENNIRENESQDLINGLEDGSQLLVVNCYPSCPEPDLTLGMPPHSDYGFLTLLLQDEVKGLQIQHEGKWVSIEPLPNSFVVNVGDHLEVSQ